MHGTTSFRASINSRLPGSGRVFLDFVVQTGIDTRLNIGTFTHEGLEVYGIGKFTGNVTVPDEAYGSTWDGSLAVPTKNAVYDKIQSLGSGGSSLSGSLVVFTAGGTPTIHKQKGVSSITRTALGRYRINFSSSRPDTHYSVFGGGRFSDWTDNAVPVIGIDRTAGFGKTLNYVDITITIQHNSASGGDLTDDGTHNVLILDTI